MAVVSRSRMCGCPGPHASQGGIQRWTPAEIELQTLSGHTLQVEVTVDEAWQCPALQLDCPGSRAGRLSRVAAYRQDAAFWAGRYLRPAPAE